MRFQAIAGLMVLLSAARAEAYVRTKTFKQPPAATAWKYNCLEFKINSETTPPDVKPQRLTEAVTGAVAAWTTGDASCADLHIVVTESGPQAKLIGNDGENHVSFVRGSEWCDVIDGHRVCHGFGMLALTTVTSFSQTGRIVDADIQVNATVPPNSGGPPPFRWGDLASGDTGTVDLQNALTHELGHALGIDHTCRLDDELNDLRQKLATERGGMVSDADFAAFDVDNLGRTVPRCGAATREQKEATMAPTTSLDPLGLRSLTPDDVAAVCTVFAASAQLLCSPPVVVEGVGCSLVRTPRTGGGAFLALLAWLLCWSRRRAGAKLHGKWEFLDGSRPS